MPERTEVESIIHDDPTSLIGKVVADRYKLESMIGSGGWSDVYEASREDLNAKFAFKLLRQHAFGNEDRLTRFHSEAAAMAKLNHAAIARLFDYGISEAGRPYIVMEIVQGKSLSELIKSGEQISALRIIGIMEQLCDALTVAHGAGIIHRDIKPSNIIVSENDRPKLLDFGVAKISQPADEKDADSTVTGRAVGSPAYMSPEQVLSKPLDGRSDIYALGCTLYEVLTGRLPFSDTSDFGIMMKHVNDVPPRLEQNLELFQPIIDRCLAKSPDDRFKSADELKQALSALKTDPRLSLADDRTKLKTQDKTSTKKIVVIAAASSVLGAAVGLGFLAAHKNPEENLIKSSTDAIEVHAEKATLRSYGPPDLSKLEANSLTKLTLSKRTLSADDMKAIAAMPNLKTLNFNDCRIEPSSFAPLKQKSLLITIGGDSDDSIMRGLHHLNKIAGIRISSSKITDAGVAELSPSKDNLRYFESIGSKLSDNAYKFLKGAKQLSVVSLSPLASDSAVEALAGCPLYSIRLAGPHITDVSIEVLSGCSTLQKVELYKCQNVTSSATRALHDKLSGCDIREAAEIPTE